MSAMKVTPDKEVKGKVPLTEEEKQVLAAQKEERRIVHEETQRNAHAAKKVQKAADKKERDDAMKVQKAAQKEERRIVREAGGEATQSSNDTALARSIAVLAESIGPLRGDPHMLNGKGQPQSGKSGSVGTQGGSSKAKVTQSSVAQSGGMASTKGKFHGKPNGKVVHGGFVVVGELSPFMVFKEAVNDCNPLTFTIYALMFFFSLIRKVEKPGVYGSELIAFMANKKKLFFGISSFLEYFLIASTDVIMRCVSLGHPIGHDPRWHGSVNVDWKESFSQGKLVFMMDTFKLNVGKIYELLHNYGPELQDVINRSRACDQTAEPLDDEYVFLVLLCICMSDLENAKSTIVMILNQSIKDLGCSKGANFFSFCLHLDKISPEMRERELGPIIRHFLTEPKFAFMRRFIDRLVRMFIESPISRDIIASFIQARIPIQRHVPVGEIEAFSLSPSLVVETGGLEEFSLNPSLVVATSCLEECSLNLSLVVATSGLDAHTYGPGVIRELPSDSIPSKFPDSPEEYKGEEGDAVVETWSQGEYQVQEQADEFVLGDFFCIVSFCVLFNYAFYINDSLHGQLVRGVLVTTYYLDGMLIAVYQLQMNQGELLEQTHLCLHTMKTFSENVHYSFEEQFSIRFVISKIKPQALEPPSEEWEPQSESGEWPQSESGEWPQSESGEWPQSESDAF
jgi:hypothetical protein